MANAVARRTERDQIGLVVRGAGSVPFRGARQVMHVEFLAAPIGAAIETVPSIPFADPVSDVPPPRAAVRSGSTAPVPMVAARGGDSGGGLRGTAPRTEPRRPTGAPERDTTRGANPFWKAAIPTDGDAVASRFRRRSAPITRRLDDRPNADRVQIRAAAGQGARRLCRAPRPVATPAYAAVRVEVNAMSWHLPNLTKATIP